MPPVDRPEFVSKEWSMVVYDLQRMKNLLPAFFVETRASKLTRLELGPKKLSGVFRICDAVVSGDAVAPWAPKTGLRPPIPVRER